VAAPLLLHHPSSLRHDAGPHPESPARIVAIEEALAAEHWLGWDREASPRAELAALEAVHSEDHVDRIEGLCLRGGGLLDADTAVSEESFVAARAGRPASKTIRSNARTPRETFFKFFMFSSSVIDFHR